MRALIAMLEYSIALQYVLYLTRWDGLSIRELAQDTWLSIGGPTQGHFILRNRDPMSCKELGALYELYTAYGHASSLSHRWRRRGNKQPPASIPATYRYNSSDTLRDPTIPYCAAMYAGRRWYVPRLSFCSTFFWSRRACVSGTGTVLQG